MKKVTFKIRRKIILAFLFVSYRFSFSLSSALRSTGRSGIDCGWWVADDLVNNILEVRRFEKNFFLYKHRSSLDEALSYADRVETLCLRHEEDLLKLTKEGQSAPFLKVLARYKRPCQGSGQVCLMSIREPKRQLHRDLKNRCAQSGRSFWIWRRHAPRKNDPKFIIYSDVLSIFLRFQCFSLAFWESWSPSTFRDF